jgi:hypothetical protein
MYLKIIDSSPNLVTCQYIFYLLYHTHPRQMFYTRLTVDPMTVWTSVVKKTL